MFCDVRKAPSKRHCLRGKCLFLTMTVIFLEKVIVLRVQCRVQWHFIQFQH